MTHIIKPVRMFSVDIYVGSTIVSNLELRAESAKEAAHTAASFIDLKAKISPRSNGVPIINPKHMNEDQGVTSMHEVTPEDKETQDNLEGVEVGEKVPMVPAEGEGDKNLQPDREPEADQE